MIIIDGIFGEYDFMIIEDEEEVKFVIKSVIWVVSSDDVKVFIVEFLKNGCVGLGLSVIGGVDIFYDDIMVSINVVFSIIFFILYFFVFYFFCINC